MKRMLTILLAACLSSGAALADDAWVKTKFDDHQDVRDILPTPAGLYVSTRAGGVFLSKDRGQTWEALNRGLPTLYTGKLILASDGTLLVGVGNTPGKGACYLADGTWKQADGLKETEKAGLGVQAFVKDSRGNILVGYAWGGGVFKSTDNGRSYTKLPATLPDTVFAFVKGPDNAIYAGTEIAGLSWSADDGGKWTYMPGTNKADRFSGGNATAIIFNDAGELVANLKDGAHCGVWRLVGGRDGKWVEAKGFDGPSRIMGFAKAADGTLFASVRRGQPYPQTYSRVMMSTDGGATWSAFSAGLPAPTQASGTFMAVDADGYAYYGTADAGLYRTAKPVARPATASASWPATAPLKAK